MDCSTSGFHVHHQLISISPSEYSGLISFRIDWLDLLTVQSTLKSLLQQHSSKPSILQCSPFFLVQVSHPYMTTEKTIALIIWTFIDNVSAFYYFFPFIFISWRLTTLQYCSGFCHTLTWISHGFTCVSHPEPPSHLSPHSFPLGHPSVSAPSTCLMYPTWTGDLFHTW